LRRRAFLATASAGLAALWAPRRASALGRTPLGGKLALRVPWPTTAIDPHDLRDATAALFAAAIADPLFGLDAGGVPYATLAATLPTREGGDVVVRLREGLRTARGAALSAADVVFSIERARNRGAGAALVEVPVPRAHPRDALAVVFKGADPQRLARALASPLAALLPRRFDAGAPDGTGAFRAAPGRTALTLTRNTSAARGHAFLDAIEVEAAEDLKASLRAFETGRDDIGWLGAGLFGERKGSVRFDLGRVAWVVLETGGEAGSFGAPGEAQRLADGLGTTLADLGLGPQPRGGGEAAWQGAPAELLFDEAAAHLTTVARAIAPVLSRPGHEVTAAPVPRAELARRRARGAFSLAVDVVRPLGPGPLGALLALATADDPARARDLARHPPKLAADSSPRTQTRTLRVGVLGELRIVGAALGDVVIARMGGGEGWDLGGTHRKPVRR
jgi:peptide/nickel transport system substrate-binding protein